MNGDEERQPSPQAEAAQETQVLPQQPKPAPQPRPDPTGPVVGGRKDPLRQDFGPIKAFGPRLLIAAVVILAGFILSYFFVAARLSQPAPDVAVSQTPPTLAPSQASGGGQATNPNWYRTHKNTVSVGPTPRPTPAKTAAAGSLSPSAPALPAPGNAALSAQLASLSSPPQSGQSGYDVGAVSPPAGYLPPGASGLGPSMAAPSTPPPPHMTVAFVQPREASGSGPTPVQFAAQAQNVVPNAGQSAPTSQQGLIAAAAGKSDYLDSGVQYPRSPFELQAGSLIPAVLAGAIVSDLQGTPRAVVTENVYDSIDQHYLLIPAGSHLIGSYAQGGVYGQNRIFIVWNRLFFPDGRYLDLGGMPSTDAQGSSGVNAHVNRHLGNSLGTVLLLTALQAGLAYATTPRQPTGAAGSISINTTPTIAQQVAQSAASQLTNLATQMTQQSLAQAPTLQIAAGARFEVAVERDIVFPGPYTPMGQ